MFKLSKLLLLAVSLTILFTGCALETKEEADARLHGKSAQTGEAADPVLSAAGKLTDVQFYVPSEDDNNISIIDVPSGKVVGQIPVREAPTNVVFSSTMREAYAANQTSSTIAFINTQTLKVEKEVPVGPMPHGLVLSPDNKTLYVATVADQYIYLVDTKAGEEAGTIDFGAGAKTNYITLFGDRIYVSDYVNNKVYVANVKTRQVERTISTGKTPRAIRLSDDGNKLYVPCAGDGILEIYDAKSGRQLRQIPVQGASDIALADDGQSAIVTGIETNTVTFVDLSNGKAVKTLTGLSGAKHIAFNRMQTKAYVTLSGSDEVAVIDTELQEVVDHIKVGQKPHGIKLKALPGIGGSC